MRTRRRSISRSCAILIGGAVFAAMLAVSPAVLAVTYQTPQNFLEEAFSGDPPKPEVLWLTEDVRAEMKRVLGEVSSAARVRYWRRGVRTAWVLEEIGKEDPITTGIVVNDGHIESIDVLIYRENRGGEVRLPYFRKQFIDAMLTDDGDLDRKIDGISGATLSVHAMKVMARRALFFHNQVMRRGM